MIKEGNYKKGGINKVPTCGRPEIKPHKENPQAKHSADNQTSTTNLKIMEKNLHPSISNLLRYFKYGHLPPSLRPVSKKFHDLANDLIDECGQGPELTVCLRKLLEAKDCAVRAALDKK